MNDTLHSRKTSALNEDGLKPSGVNRLRGINSQMLARVPAYLTVDVVKPPIVGAAHVDTWHFLLCGLWLSGLRLGEALAGQDVRLF